MFELAGYKKVYCDHFDYEWGDFIPSEISEKTSVDIHHIQPQQRGGTKKLDRVENLMALTRKEHEDYGGIKMFKAMLYRIHKARLIAAGKPFDEKWIDKQIKRFEVWERKQQ